jgi:uncharacterized protein with von Willebrand factor type A (vWA) domain
MITLPEFAVQGFMTLLFGIAFYAFRRDLQSIHSKLADIKSEYSKDIQDVKNEYSKAIQEVQISLKERSATAHGRISDRDKQHKEDLCAMRNQHKEDMKEIFALMTPKQLYEGNQNLWQERFENLMAQNKREHDYIIERVTQWDEQMEKITECLKKMAREEAC